MSNGEFTSLRSLLEFHVKTMHLRPEAPWPTQCEHTKDLIKAYQRSQQKVKPHVAGPDDLDGGCDSDDLGPDSLVGA